MSTDHASMDSSTEVLRLERHGIDFIPLSARHGRPSDLFTLWFGANMMAVTLATVAIATTTETTMYWPVIHRAGTPRRLHRSWDWLSPCR